MIMTPININVFIAAYSGAIAGMATSGWITDPVSTDYSFVTAIAGAYAQEFDAVWNNATPINTLEQASITAVVSENFRGRGPGPLADSAFTNPQNWSVNVAACIAVITEGNVYFASQGIVPPPVPLNNPPPIRIPVELTSLFSNTSIPANDVVSQIIMDVGIAYSTGTTIKVICNGQTLFDTTDGNPQSIGLYTLPTDIVITADSVVNVIVDGNPTVGSSAISITYSLPTN
jgi:hypothetical protein